MRERGVRLLGDPGPGKPITGVVCVHPRETKGVLMQLVQRKWGLCRRAGVATRRRRRSSAHGSGSITWEKASGGDEAAASALEGAGRCKGLKEGLETLRRPTGLAIVARRPR
jgi:hypothetical protein